MTLIDLPYVTVSFESPVVYYQYKEGAELGFPEMKELIVAAERLSWSRPYFTFSDVRVKMGVTPEGRRYLSDFQHMPYFRGAAVLAGSNMMSLALNFFNHFQKKSTPSGHSPNVKRPCSGCSHCLFTAIPNNCRMNQSTSASSIKVSLAKTERIQSRCR